MEPKSATLLRILAISLFLLFCFNTLQADTQQEKSTTVRIPTKFSFITGNAFSETKEWKFLSYLPAGYAESRSTWPLMIYLHGSSLRGDDLEMLKRYGPPSFLDNRDDFPFVVISPQLPEGEIWDPETLMPLVMDIVGKYKIDKHRVCITGVSMGAIGAYNLAAKNQNRFSAIVPVCGSGEVTIAPKINNLPIWAFHGEHDKVTPIAPHTRLIDAIIAAGGQAKLSIVPEGTHGNIIFPVYNRQSMYDWLLAQTRKPKPILKIEPRIAEENLKPGDQEGPEPKKLEIPKKPKLPLLNINQKASHQVKKGESLWKIGQLYNVTVEALIRKNKLKSNIIQVDQILQIPTEE